MKRKIYLMLTLMAVVLVTVACSLTGGIDTGDISEEPQAEPTRVPATKTPVANVPEPTEVPEEEEPEEQGKFSIEALEGNLDQFVIRPEDLPHDYKILPGGEVPYGNSVIMYDMGEVRAKRYIVNTGRVAGWNLELQRERKADIVPYTMFSKVELFDTVEGAETAFSEEWLPVYLEEADDEGRPVHWIDNGCDFGDECIMYYYEKFDPATELTQLQYEVVFLYDNLLATVMGRGLDIDMNPDYILNAAEIMYGKIDAAASN